MNTNNALALDKSARIIDEDGRLHVAKTHISKANICPYYGKEIPGWQELGLLPDKIYRLYRDPEELKKAASTFARLPVLSKHVPVTVDNPQPSLVVGAIGSDVSFNPPYLDADICVWDKMAIAGIETGVVRELSCAYRYAPEMTPGNLNGDLYDGVMRQIRGNHLALVEVGRAGADVVVADSCPDFKNGGSFMNKTKLGVALIAALGAMSPVLASDSAGLTDKVGAASKKGFDKAGIKQWLIAKDATLDPQQLDRVIDALLDVEQEPSENPDPANPAAGATDETPEGKIKTILAGKVDDETLAKVLACITPATDETPESGKGNQEDIKAAMDAAIGSAVSGLRKQFLDANEAARAVRPVVGDVMGMDSAEEIYAFALNHMGVDHASATAPGAKRAIFHAVFANKATPLAKDGAPPAKLFPALGRFSQA